MHSRRGTTDPPPIDSVRPTRCPHCLVPAGVPGALNIWGHGIRWREVVVLHGDGVRIDLACQRRFRCCRCGECCAVLPHGVIPRHIYSLAVIVVTWFLTVAPPIGDGLDDAAAYARHGVERRRAGSEPGRAGRRRWRSLRRWTRSVPVWWPTRTAIGATWRERAASLLTGFLPGDGGRDGATRRALAAHAVGGTAM